MKHDHLLAVFNRGLVSKLAMGRVDVSRIALSAEQQVNWMPRTLGPMSLRPGLGYKGTIAGDGAYVPFIFSHDDNAVVELSPSAMRVWDTGDTLVTRPTGITSAITNETFDTNLNGWTDLDEGAAVSQWATGGYMELTGTGTDRAIRSQQITTGGGQMETEHALRIVVTQGRVLLKIGINASLPDSILEQTVLRPGTHSIAFTPGNGISFFTIELSTTLDYPCLIDSVEMEAGGVMSLPTPWTTAAECRAVRYDQSGDVIFLSSAYQQRRIERRENNSWSLVLYEPDDGPFLTENTGTDTITPSALTGEITLTASSALFKLTHVGSIWQISSQGQKVLASISAQNTFSDPVLVTGVSGGGSGSGSGRALSIVVGGTWAGTVTLQRSVGSIGNWVDVESYTINTTKVYTDEFDNSDIYYRLGIKTGDYTSGTAQIDLQFPAGSITGVVRVIAHTSSTVVTGVVLSPLGGTDATEFWAEGAWSDENGWPTAVAFYQGRLWWAGSGRLYGSVSDAFASFDPDYIGDAAPINRTVGDGPVNDVNWLMPLERLIAGTDQREQSIRSNSLDEPVTPSNYNSKATSTKGAAPVVPAISNAVGYFVGKNTSDIYEMRWLSDTYSYRPVKATLLVPELGATGFVRVAVQEEPDVRVHCVRADGTAAVLVRDEAEDVLAWVEVTTDGLIEDVVVLPGTLEDRVFYRVKRTIGGVDYRYHEEWAREDQCRGASQSLLGDSFLSGTGPITTITGLDHLEGETVVCWADGTDQGTFTVASGQITLPAQIDDDWMVGLSYTADYKSSKLAAQTKLGFDITRRKKIDQIGLLLAWTHAQGLKYGPDFDNLDDMPLTEDEVDVVTGTVHETYDEDSIEFPGEWDTDSRICLRAAAPRPCTVMAALLSIDRQPK